MRINKKNLKWWQKTIVYEAYPSSFQDTDGDGIGNLKGITMHLDYLKSFGVGAIWLTPVYASPMKDNGYDISDYYAINPTYGSMEDMEELIAEAKKRGIRIVMDMVFNHTSDKNAWFTESASSRDNAKADWYIWRDAKEDGSAPNNWGGIFGGSVWTWCETRQQYYLHTFGDFQPDLNWENPEVRRALYDVANFWLDKGVGGFRLDAVTYIKKPKELADGPVNPFMGYASVHDMTANTEGILDFLHEFRSMAVEGHDIFAVGEANGVSSDELDKWVGEKGVFDMLFEFSHVNVQFDGPQNWCQTRPWKLTDLKKAFFDSQKATENTGWYPIFLENHDQPRSVNHFLPADAENQAAAKALGMLATTLRGTPFIYQGEELGMTNVQRQSIEDYDDVLSINQYEIALNKGFTKEEALACVMEYSRDNARTPMQWDASENAGFSAGRPWLGVNPNFKTVNAALQENDESSVLNWYRSLYRLREEYSLLIDGDFGELFSDSEEIFAYTRENDNQKAIILINFTGKNVSYDAQQVFDAQPALFSGKSCVAGSLEPYQAVCYIKDKG
ncbi:MAG: alpha-glucosidase [Lachnospiraceae bacterium]|nr:alpha-glucosidase [Lachnospiraceae bacterium]